MKWLLCLVFITILFVLYSFIMPVNDVFSYRWMTLGVAAVAFLQYYVVKKSNLKNAQKMIGGHLAAIVIKFILSFVVLILYIILFGPNLQITPFIYFFVALVLYSIINYVGSYYS